MLRLLVVASLMVFAEAATAADPVGGVSRVAGQCTATLDGNAEILDLTSAIFLRQTVGTQAASRLEITFVDTTRLTLGENAQITIDRFVYNPKKKNRISLAVSGAMRFVGPPRTSPAWDERITTPIVDIGARGTDFWAGPIDGKYGVLLLQGAVTVSNSAGRVVLDRPGQGVSVASRNDRPGPVIPWPQEKVRRALAMTAF